MWKININYRLYEAEGFSALAHWRIGVYFHNLTHRWNSGDKLRSQSRKHHTKRVREGLCLFVYVTVCMLLYAPVVLVVAESNKRRRYGFITSHTYADTADIWPFSICEGMCVSFEVYPCAHAMARHGMARVGISKKAHTKLSTIHATYFCTQDTHTHIKSTDLCVVHVTDAHKQRVSALDFWQKQTLLFVLAICLAFAVLRIFHTSRFACMCRMIFVCLLSLFALHTSPNNRHSILPRDYVWHGTRARTRAQVQSFRNASSTGFCCRFCRAIQYKKRREDKHNAYDINTDRCMMYYYSWHMIVCVCVFSLFDRWLGG